MYIVYIAEAETGRQFCTKHSGKLDIARPLRHYCQNFDILSNINEAFFRSDF